MKKLMIAIAALSVFCLSACDFFNKGDKSGEDKSSKEVEVDTKLYGTGADEETLRVGTDIPVGEYVALFKAPTSVSDTPSGAGFVGTYQGSVDPRNMLWEDFFKTSSMCQLKSGQVVKLQHAQLQNIEANPKIGELEDGTFKVGTHFQSKNGVVKVKCTRSESGSASGYAGMVTFRTALGDTSYYLDGEGYGAVNNLLPDQEIEFPGVLNGTYISLSSAKIVL